MVSCDLDWTVYIFLLGEVLSFLRKVLLGLEVNAIPGTITCTEVQLFPRANSALVFQVLQRDVQL